MLSLHSKENVITKITCNQHRSTLEMQQCMRVKYQNLSVVRWFGVE